MFGIDGSLRDAILAGLAAVDAGAGSDERSGQFALLAPPSHPEDLKGLSPAPRSGSHDGASSSPSAVSQALFFLKPELLYAELDRGRTIDAVNGVLVAAGITVGGAAVLGPARLADTIAAHYGVINRVSRLGLAALSPAARVKLDEAFGDQLSSGVPALGGHEVVARYGVGDEELETLLGAPTKLAPGTYATTAVIGGETIVVLNGFHPAQLAHFTKPAARVLAMEIFWSDRTWASFRTDVVGATNPAKAVAGSVRGMLLASEKTLGLGPVGLSANGVHGSAGPIEAMVEIARFLEITPVQTSLGAALLDNGVPMATILDICSSEEDGGARQAIFDATEEVEPAEAIAHITRP